MNRISSCVALSIALLCTSTPRAQEVRPNENLKPVFDGKTLNGWVPSGEGVYRVENGIIIGTSGKGGHGWLCTAKRYGDFVMELDVKAISGNSGIQIRSNIDDKNTMVGYQIEVDPSERAWSGGLYEQGRRGWLQDLTQNEAGRKAFKPKDWNHYRIEAIGDRIRTWVNNVPITDYVDSMDVEGVIALQVHSGQGVHVEFKDIRLQDLGRRAWKPLWDGKTLNGWHTIGKGEWTIKDGAIFGNQVKTEKEYGHVVSDAAYKDFTVRLKFKAIQGNSGFYFRTEEKGFSGISGFQAEIDPERDAGGLYETNGRAWVVQPKLEDVKQWYAKKWYKSGDWNALTVSAHGLRIVVNLNGHKSAEINDDKGRTEGRFALQLHGEQDVQVMFKDIEILGEPELEK